MECLEYCPCPYDNKTNDNASEHSKQASLVRDTNVLGDKRQTDSRSQKSLLRSQSQNAPMLFHQFVLKLIPLATLATSACIALVGTGFSLQVNKVWFKDVLLHITKYDTVISSLAGRVKNGIFLEDLKHTENNKFLIIIKLNKKYLFLIEQNMNDS